CSTCPNTINEMLCMSHRQLLRLFPVWPKNKDARFINIRAQGAFLVSSTLKGGVVKFARIISEKGRNCTLVNPWPGKAVDVYRDSKKVETLKGDRFVMKTEVGGVYMLGPEGSAEPKMD
ncbi:MAG: glycoside hydrolase family 95-like protein, partial [bacterium]